MVLLISLVIGVHYLFIVDFSPAGHLSSILRFHTLWAQETTVLLGKGAFLWHAQSQNILQFQGGNHAVICIESFSVQPASSQMMTWTLVIY